MNDPFSNKDYIYEGLKPAKWNKDEEFHVFSSLHGNNQKQYMYYSNRTKLLRYSVMPQDNGKYVVDLGETFRVKNFTERDFRIKECSHKNVFEDRK